MADVMDVAASVQAIYGARPLSWWKMHKLLYFCQGWSLAWHGRPLFDDRVEAWKNGPVVREVYRVQKHYPLTKSGSADVLLADHLAVVNEVVRFYGRFSAETLIGLTHREPPWRVARCGVAAGDSSRNEITRPSMRDYFVTLADETHRIPEGVNRTIDVLMSVPEDQVDHIFDDSGVDFAAELASLRGQGPDPWPHTESHPRP